MKQMLLKMIDYIKTFLATVPGSVWGHVNKAELVRVVGLGITAWFAAGGGWMGFVKVAEIFGTNAYTIDPSLSSNALIVSLITMAMDYMRRKWDAPVVPSPKPIPPVSPVKVTTV
jgi:hypothetical protein